MKGNIKVDKKCLILFSIIVLFTFISGCNGVTPSGYTITATAETGGSIDSSGTVAVTEGSNQIFIIIPDEDYEVANILLDGASEGVVTSYTFLNIQQDHSIQVSFTGLGVYNTHTEVYYATIQEAIDAALAGENILVYPGTYVENILFEGKNITVSSIVPQDPPIVASTIIDGGESDSVVKFTGGDTSTLEGFTIQNGNALYGGGIYVKDSSPTITSNTITGNAASNSLYGGGIYVYISDPIITGNTISHNMAGYGGGIYIVYTTPTITGNHITFNTSTYGGGMYIVESSSSPLNIGGTGSSDTGNFNTICGNTPNQIL